MLKNLTKETVKKYIPEVISVLYFPLTLIYLELALKIKASPDAVMYWLPALLFSAAFGVLIGALCLMIHNKTVRYIVTGLALSAVCLYFTVEAFMQSAYQVFMTIDSIAQGTGGVLTDFSDTFFKAIKNGAWVILLFFMPVFLFLLIIFAKSLAYEHRVEHEHRVPVLIGSLFVLTALCVEGFVAVHSNPAMLGVYRDAYNFNNAVCSFGLVTGTRLDIQYSIFGDPSAGEFVVEQPAEPSASEEDSSQGEESSQQPEEQPVEYG